MESQALCKRPCPCPAGACFQAICAHLQICEGPLGRGWPVRDDDAQCHEGYEQHHKDTGHHGATVLLLRAALTGIRLHVASFAVRVWFRAEDARDGLRNAVWLGRGGARSAVVVRIVLDMVFLRNGGILGERQVLSVCT